MSDETLERGAMRTIAWRLLPLIFLRYGVSYVDRVNLRLRFSLAAA